MKLVENWYYWPWFVFYIIFPNIPKIVKNVVYCGHSFYISELWRGGGESSPPSSVFEAQKMTGLKPRAGASLCKLSAGSLDRNKAVAPQYLLTLAMSSCWFRIHPNLSRHNTLCPKLVVSKANDILNTQISA